MAQDAAGGRRALSGLGGRHRRPAGAPDVGFPAAFINGNMTAGTFRDRILVRLPPPELEAQLEAGWTTFEPMPGRPMTGYLAVPSDVAADADQLRGWVERAADYVRTLPPKEPKSRKR